VAASRFQARQHLADDLQGVGRASEAGVVSSPPVFAARRAERMAASMSINWSFCGVAVRTSVAR